MSILKWPLIILTTWIAGYLLAEILVGKAYPQPYPIDQLIPSKPPPVYNTQPTTTLTPEQQLREKLRIQDLKNELLRKEWEQKMFEEGIKSMRCDSFRKNLGLCDD